MSGRPVRPAHAALTHVHGAAGSDLTASGLTRSRPAALAPIARIVAMALVVPIALIALTALGPSNARAQSRPPTDGARLVEAARCNACHQMNDVLLGPPWTAIAARHAPRRDVMVDVLARKIVLGGGGNWGLVPMVPNQQVTAEQAHAMSEWILSLADSR